MMSLGIPALESSELYWLIFICIGIWVCTLEVNVVVICTGTTRLRAGIATPSSQVCTPLITSGASDSGSGLPKVKVCVYESPWPSCMFSTAPRPEELSPDELAAGAPAGESAGDDGGAEDATAGGSAAIVAPLPHPTMAASAAQAAGTRITATRARREI